MSVEVRSRRLVLKVVVSGWAEQPGSLLPWERALVLSLLAGRREQSSANREIPEAQHGQPA